MKDRLNQLVDGALETQRGQLVSGFVLLVLSVLFFVAFALLAMRGAVQEGEAFLLQLSMALVSVPFFGSLVFFFAGSGMGFPRGLRYGVATYIVVGLIAVVLGVPGGVGGGVVNAGPFWPFFVFVTVSCSVGFTC